MSRVIDALDRVLGARLSVDPEIRKKISPRLFHAGGAA